MVDANCSGGAWPAEMAAAPASTDAYTWLAQCGMDCAGTVPATGHAVADGLALGPHLAVQSSMPWQPPRDSAWLAYPLAPSAIAEQSAHAMDDGSPAVGCSPTSSATARTAAAPSATPKITEDGSEATPRERPREPAAERAPSARDATETAETDSLASSGDEGRDKHRRPYRHKRRAGRVVRERRSTRRTKREPFSFQSLVYGAEGDRDESAYSSDRVKVLLADCLAEFKRAKLYLHAMRFGLFCAMAWSMNSIIFSAAGLNPR